MFKPHIPLIDTNILIDAFSLNTDKEKALTLMDKGVYLTDFVLTELLNFIQNRYSAPDALQAINHIIKRPKAFIFIPTIYNLFPRAEKLMRKYLDNRLAFTDCYLLALAETEKLTLHTKDEKMGRYPNATVVNPY